MAESNNINNNQDLARLFLDATLDQWGTDEEVVDQILEFVQKYGKAAEFEKAVFQEIDPEKAKRFMDNFPATRLVPAILKDELGGSALARAEDFYNPSLGIESYRADRVDYFLEGLASPLDLSGTESKLVAGVGIAAFVGLYLISAPLAAVVGGGLVIGMSIYGIGKAIKNGVEILTTDSEIEVKENLRDLGTAVTITAMSAPLVPKGIRTLRQAQGNAFRGGLQTLRSKGALTELVGKEVSTIVKPGGHLKVVGGTGFGPKNSPTMLGSGSSASLSSSGVGSNISQILSSATETGLRIIARADSENVIHLFGPRGNSAQVYLEGNVVAKLNPVSAASETIPPLEFIPRPRLTLSEPIPAPISKPAFEPGALTLNAIPLAPLIGIVDEENYREKQEAFRRLQRLEQMKKQTEIQLGYKLYDLSLQRQFDKLQTQLNDLNQQGAFHDIQASNGAALHLEVIPHQEFRKRKEKKPLVFTDKIRLYHAFQQALQMAKEQGLVLMPREVADRAHAIYCQGLDEEKRPSQGTFRGKVSGPHKDSELLKMMDASGVTTRRGKVINLEKLFQSFVKTTQEAKQNKEFLTLQAAADRAHEIYCQDLEKKDWPSQKTLRARVTGPQRDPKILKMLKKSGVFERGTHPIDEEKLLKAFAQVVQEAKRRKQILTIIAAMHRAYEIYCQGLPKKDRPSLATIHNKVNESKQDSKIFKLIKNSGVVGRSYVPVDEKKLFEAFAQVVQEAKQYKEILNLLAAADRAYEIYCKGLAEKNRPNARTFHAKVSGSNKNPEILKMLLESGVVEKQVGVPIDSEKLFRAFSQMLQEAKKQGKVLTLMEAAYRAYVIYCQGLTAEEMPTQGTFQQKISGPNKDPKIRIMLERSGLVKRWGTLLAPSKATKKGRSEKTTENR